MPRPNFARKADPSSASQSSSNNTSSTRNTTYGDHSSSHWAPGWTFDRFSKATKEELLVLPRDELAKMQAGFRDVLGEDGVAALAEHLFQEQMKAAASPSTNQKAATSGQPRVEAAITPAWLKHWRKRYGDQPWGFVAMCTTCYDDTEHLEEFKAKFQKIVEIPFEREEGMPGVEDAKANFQIRWIEDPNLEGASPEVLREKYEVLRPNLPANLSQGVFLCASSDVVASVLDAVDAESSPSTESKRWRPSAPYILAVAANADPGLEEGHEEREWFRPVFKVAVETLVDEFWWIVDPDMMPLRRITRNVKSVSDEAEGQHADLEEIWWSTAPSPARLRNRSRVG